MRALIISLFLMLGLVANAQSGISGGTSTLVYPVLVSSQNQTGLTANVAQTTLYTVPAGRGGMYALSCYVVVTTAATTSSNTPNCQVQNYTDADTAVTKSVSITGQSATNTIGTTQNGVQFINAAAGSAIPWGSVNYTSVGATPLAYAIHIRLEYLGP